jgi:pimeloyl-ACP methyl ester carboxylesterase
MPQFIARLLAIGAGLFVAVLLFNWSLARLAEHFAPPQGQFIEVDGLRLHYVDTGAKPGQAEPPLLFLHGLMGSLGHFDYRLAALFPERRVIMLDRPGSGYSQAAPSQGLKAQAALIADFLAALPAARPMVVGHSFGGAVALNLALDHPDSLCGLTLLAPLTHQINSPPSVFRGLGRGSAMGRWLYAWTLAPIRAIFQAGEAARVIFGPDKAPADFWNKGGAILALRPGNFITGSREMRDLRPELPLLEQRYPSLATKTFILFGKGDQVLDPNVQGPNLRDRAPHAELTLVNGGHMLPIEQPDLTAAFIRSALVKSGCSG